MSDNGAWEICQFRDAVLQPSGAWALSGLLRGQAGSDEEAQTGASAGARFVLLTPAVTQISFSLNQRGTAYDWQAGPEGGIPDTAVFSEKTLTMNARGLIPLSPVHLRARREGDDIRLSWTRRTRQGGDNWQGEVPLSENSERYRLRIYDGANVARAIETSAPEYLYASADIAADFGAGAFDGPSAAINFAVAQISDAVGEGEENRNSTELV